MIKNVPKTVILYWKCLHCGALHNWLEEKARFYCNAKCANAAYYLRRKSRDQIDL